MASNAISDITDEFLVCQVCLEDFRQPKVLPCLHTFCQPCLDRLLATEPAGKLDCPTCRQDVPLPENGVQGLKSNFLVGKLRDILQQQPKGETSQAREDAAAAELRARETSKCEDHQELNKFYCDTCHRVICLHCVVTAHKDHQYVEIEKAAEREGEKIKAKLATVKNTADLHQNWIQDLQSVKDEWSAQIQRSEEQIRKQVNSIIEAAKKAGNDRIAQLRAMNAAREKQMEAAMEAAEMGLASATSCVQFTDNVLEYGSPAELMSVVGELTGRLDQTADEKKAGKAEMIKDLVNLIVKPSIYNVEQEVSKLVGEVTKTLIPMLSSPPMLTTQVQPNMVIGKDDRGLKRIKVVGKDRDGQFELLTSLAVTAEGDIVATDYGNSRLQFLGEDGSCKKKVDLRFKPRGGHVSGRRTDRTAGPTADEKKADKVDMTKDLVNLTVEPLTYNVEQGVSKLVGEITKTAIPKLSSPPTSTTQVRHNMVIGKDGGGLKLIKVVGKNRVGQFKGVTSLAVTAEGDIVATDSDNSRLQFLGKDGSFKKKVDLRFQPWSVAALTNGELLVTGDGHRIHVLDKQGRESRVIQVAGAEEKDETTLGIAVDGLGRIIVTIRHQVFKLSPSGDVIMKIGGKDQGPQDFGPFLRVAVNSRNQIIVSDWFNNKMMMFDPSGRHLFTCGSYGSGPGQLNLPHCVITDREDNIIVTDFWNHRVSLFSRDGTFMRHVLTETEHSLGGPRGLALTHDGHLIVSEYNDITFFMYNAT
uniref:RING-type E3 ubiquitin transferase n=1 Tax=Branchiostoma floridae TaxID=7739 RepID=C3Y6P1_BRAFL|eukprot:XP_002607991.1 hypothetical protein BRAFLDRAFT_213581 [Branchiostoma floridae]